MRLNANEEKLGLFPHALSLYGSAAVTANFTGTKVCHLTNEGPGEKAD